MLDRGTSLQVMSEYQLKHSKQRIIALDTPHRK
jgi:hypothetical protein